MIKKKKSDFQALNNISFEIKKGKAVGILGENGSGKSTLSYVLSGREGYEVTAGEVIYKGKNLLELEVEERAAEGVFVAFQYPVEIPGVGNSYFLRTALNAMRKHRGEEELDGFEFLKLLKEKMAVLEMDDKYKKRFVNVGFSGGEKKRYEILQMALLEPVLSVLDETDSGLDVDALKIVSDGVNLLRDPARSMLVITHYQRLLNHIVPDYVHILAGGKIRRTGGKELALEVEESGYVGIDDAA